MKDYYKILGIKFNSDISTIKRAYRNLALKFHPDINKNSNAQSIFIEIIEAYEVLKDEKSKQEYDFLYKFKIQQNANDSSTSRERNDMAEREIIWNTEAVKKAKTYSNIPFKRFTKILNKELRVGVNYIPNLIAILFILTVITSLLMVLPEIFKTGAGNGLFLILLVLGMGYLVYRLSIVLILDFNLEVKYKNLKK